MQTGKKIKLLRNIIGLSQKELADKIGRTRALVSHIEQTGKINHSTLLSILKVFNMDMHAFENFESHHAKPHSLKEKLQEENTATLLQERLDSYQKENKVLKELVESQKEIISILRNKGKRKS